MARTKNTNEQVDALRARGFTGGTLAAEYDRTAEMVREILRTKGDKGPALAVWLLADSNYDNADLREVAKRL